MYVKNVKQDEAVVLEVGGQKITVIVEKRSGSASRVKIDAPKTVNIEVKKQAVA